MSSVRIENDTMGQVEVPSDRLYGAQSARSLINFAIGWEQMPPKSFTHLVVLSVLARSPMRIWRLEC